ncbi:universal stress protein [Halobacteria archaeon AArc-curdl1]|uniref:Universal stress protein n=1 Tax=Natronosalvus hydrolyticus TaxID=2979988 RepID=A0AAP2Z6R3_9EURY|nr:universal stress protein [Halobacteria archaeon AArc-curdl1]
MSSHDTGTVTILVPHDGSDPAQAAFEYAIETFPGADLVLFHAIDPFDLPHATDERTPLTDRWLEVQHARATDLFEAAIADLPVDVVRESESEGGDAVSSGEGREESTASTPPNRRYELESNSVETATSVGSPAQSIVAYVDDNDIDQVVLGSRGRGGVPAPQIGSTAEIVVKRVAVPVTVVR